jgi:hypothetical protein
MPELCPMDDLRTTLQGIYDELGSLSHEDDMKAGLVKAHSFWQDLKTINRLRQLEDLTQPQDQVVVIEELEDHLDFNQVLSIVSFGKSTLRNYIKDGLLVYKEKRGGRSKHLYSKEEVLVLDDQYKAQQRKRYKKKGTPSQKSLALVDHL